MAKKCRPTGPRFELDVLQYGTTSLLSLKGSAHVNKYVLFHHWDNLSESSVCHFHYTNQCLFFSAKNHK